MIQRGQFWALIFCALAISTGLSFFIIGWSAAITAVVRLKLKSNCVIEIDP
jgi:hypothetical protein